MVDTAVYRASIQNFIAVNTPLYLNLPAPGECLTHLSMIYSYGSLNGCVLIRAVAADTSPLLSTIIFKRSALARARGLRVLIPGP